MSFPARFPAGLPVRGHRDRRRGDGWGQPAMWLATRAAIDRARARPRCRRRPPQLSHQSCRPLRRVDCPRRHDWSGDGQRRARGGAIWGPVASDGHEPDGVGRAQGRERAADLPRRRHGGRCRGAAGGQSGDFRCPRETLSIAKGGQQRNQGTSTPVARSCHSGAQRERLQPNCPTHRSRSGTNGPIGL